MSLKLEIPEEIVRSAEEIARRKHTTPEAILLHTLGLHFPPVSAELQAEFEAWEAASDEDMLRLERPE